VLFEGQVWFRRGSKNTVAGPEDLRRMILAKEPFSIGRLSNPVVDELLESLRAQGIETAYRPIADKETYLMQGAELVYYPGTRREIHQVPGTPDETVLFCKPAKS